MHSLDREIAALRGEVDEEARGRAAALDSGRLFSLHTELWLALYAAVLAVTGGVGLLVHANLDRIGPGALDAGLFVLALVCYGVALRARLRGRERSLPEDYVLLLGALLTSAAVAYGEAQFHWFGADWSRHLLILAAVHFATAYAFDSRLVLSVALTSFLAWVGIALTPRELLREGRVGLTATLVAWRGLGCAVAFLVASGLHARVRKRPAFCEVYEQFAAHLAFGGALALGFQDGTLAVGAALLVLCTGLALVAGLRQGRESLVLYAVAYATFGTIALEAKLLRDPLLVSNLGLVTIGVAVVVLMKLRARLKESQP